MQWRICCLKLKLRNYEDNIIWIDEGNANHSFAKENWQIKKSYEKVMQLVCVFLQNSWNLFFHFLFFILFFLFAVKKIYLFLFFNCRSNHKLFHRRLCAPSNFVFHSFSPVENGGHENWQNCWKLITHQHSKHSCPKHVIIVNLKNKKKQT